MGNSAIEAGMANYLTGDFLDTAELDSADLNQRRSISATPHSWVGGQGEGGTAWGAFSGLCEKNTHRK
jgi:hypothetical protein